MRKPLIGALATVTALGAVGAAVAATPQFVQTYELSYTQKKPKKNTGFKTLITSADPGDPNGKPAATKQVIVTFAKGTKFDTTVVPQCKSTSDKPDEIAAACKKSIIGKGTAEANARPLLPLPAKEVITAYNTRNGIIFALVAAPGAAGQPLVLRGKLSGGKLVTDVPALVLPGNIKVVLTKFELDIKAQKGKKSGKGRKRKTKYYALTPAKCTGGSFVTKAQFIYNDGTPSKTIESKSSCKK